MLLRQSYVLGKDRAMISAKAAIIVAAANTTKYSIIISFPPETGVFASIALASTWLSLCKNCSRE
jgi:hypothetical protein